MNILIKITTYILNLVFTLSVLIIIIPSLDYIIAFLGVKKGGIIEFILFWVGFFYFFKFFTYVLNQQKPQIRLLILSSVVAIELTALSLLLLFNTAGE